MGRTGTQPPEIHFGRNLRRWRRQKGIHLREVSDSVSLSLGYLCDLENGKRGISLGNAVKIATYANKKLQWFLRDAQ